MTSTNQNVPKPPYGLKWLLWLTAAFYAALLLTPVAIWLNQGLFTTFVGLVIFFLAALTGIASCLGVDPDKNKLFAGCHVFSLGFLILATLTYAGAWEQRQVTLSLWFGGLALALHVLALTGYISAYLTARRLRPARA